MEKVLKKLGYNIEYIDIKDEDMEELGTLPQELSELDPRLISKKYNV